MFEKKYKLTDETIEVYGNTLHRIESLRDFGDVKKGDKGGWIQSDDNLSHNRDCWIYDDAKVYGEAFVSDCAKICENSVVYGKSQIFGFAKVYGHSKVYGCSEVCGNAQVFEVSEVYGYTKISDYAKVYGHSKVYGCSEVCGNTQVYGYSQVYGNAFIYGHAKILGEVEVYGEAEIRGKAVIKTDSDYIVFKNSWSSGRYFTWTRSNNMWKVGCFYGTSEELIEKAYEDGELVGNNYEATVKYVETLIENEKTYQD